MSRPRVAVFASGTTEGGGSGFENLYRSPDLDAEIAVVVSNHEHGGVRARAERLGVPFVYFHAPYEALRYADILSRFGAQWCVLSGWLKRVEGLDPAKTFNIHPALLSYRDRYFGGPGLYGHRVHEAVKLALDAGEISESGPTMHFTTDEYDEGPVFFECRVPLASGMDTETIAKAVNAVEHEWQPRITNLVVHGDISWDGVNPGSLVVPDGYAFLPVTK